MASLERGGRLADRYELQDRLGDGGHAEVWSAQDLARGGRVALKFLHLRSCQPEEALQVLRHESAMARRLEHPAVLRVDEPVRDGPLVFLPLEYAPGGDASRLRGAPWQRLVPVLLDVARVLEHAHSRGVVHRDIKPGNVLFDAHGAVRLTDFGTAARTGCTDGYAAGSPFSASPQQLRGEPATTADDVYGLGALAYELLGGYPPWYPDFDAERVQREDPPPPRPRHPAPAALVALVQAMLARAPQERPDLDDVMQVLQQLQAAALEAPVEGAARIAAVEEAPAAAPAAPPRRWRQGLGWLAAAVVAGVGLWSLRAQVSTAPPAGAVPAQDPAVLAAAPAVPAAVAEAVVARESTGPAVAPVAPARDGAEEVATALAAGDAALAALQPVVARAAYQRALLRDPSATRATAGIAAAAALERAVTRLAEATRAEAQGALDQARTAYGDALRERPGLAPAAAGLARVEARLRDERFEALLAAGAVALRQGRTAAALEAYRQADLLQPQEPRVQEGQSRVAEVLRSERNAQDLSQGATLERGERWDDAVAHYQVVLARDASLRFAQDGLARAERRQALDRELADYLARPERLTAPAVQAAAERALARGAASADGAPRLAMQLAALRARLQVLAEPVKVALVSDDTTQVTVARVGDLGAFRERELTLKPGHYTVIGRRDGYRDVRLELEILPGQASAALAVRCTERI